MLSPSDVLIVLWIWRWHIHLDCNVKFYLDQINLISSYHNKSEILKETIFMALFLYKVFRPYILDQNLIIHSNMIECVRSAALFLWSYDFAFGLSKVVANALPVLYSNVFSFNYFYIFGTDRSLGVFVSSRPFKLVD